MSNRTPSTLEAVDRLLGVFEAPSPGASAAGLVTSAKTREDPHSTDWDAFLRQANESQRTMRFPTAELIGAAAASFPQGVRQASGYRWSTVAADGSLSVQHHSLAEGVFPHVVIGPGLVKFSRANVRATEVTQDPDHLGALIGRPDMYLPEPPRDESDWTDSVDDSDNGSTPPASGLPTRGAIVQWSPKSRARLRFTISTLDLQPMLERGTPAMVTLTLPGDWYAVAPDAASAQRAFDNFSRAYRDKWGQSLQCIWKREFQRRGAPHWHLWMVLPTDDATFKRWLADTWRRCLKIPRPEGIDGAEHVTAQYHPETGKRTGWCSCSDWCKSYNAGTSVDRAEGMRARDPRRLATYFLKESMGGAKEYQNAAPDVWGVHNLNHGAGEVGPQPESPEHPSVGRFWGVRGIKRGTVEVPVAPEDQYRLWRSLRRIREIRSGNRSVRVMRVDAAGVVRYRNVTRRNRVQQSAGWVLVNDGAATGERIGSWMGDLHDERTRGRELTLAERARRWAAAGKPSRGPSLAGHGRYGHDDHTVFPDAESGFWAAF